MLPIALSLVDIAKIIISDKFKHNDKGSKYFIGYTDDNIIRPLCQKLPDRKIYWEATPILLCKQGLIQCLVLRSSVFFGIFIFVTTNNLITKILEAPSRD